jgi:hypothetical protein
MDTSKGGRKQGTVATQLGPLEQTSFYHWIYRTVLSIQNILKIRTVYSKLE